MSFYTGEWRFGAKHGRGVAVGKDGIYEVRIGKSGSNVVPYSTPALRAPLCDVRVCNGSSASVAPKPRPGCSVQFSLLATDARLKP